MSKPTLRQFGFLDPFFPSVFWRFCKSIPVRFSPGSFATLNPGGRGGGLLARVGNWPRPWPICYWFAGGQLLKAGGRCFVLTLPASRTLSFHCISLHFTHLLYLAWGFCVDMAPCWSGPCHVHAWRANLLARVWSEDFWPVGLSLSFHKHFSLKGQYNAIWQLYKKLEGVFASSLGFHVT